MKSKPLENPEVKPCKFLLIMTYANIVLLFALNLYIAYNIVLFFMGDGFQFMAGIMLGAAYFITIPANIFFVYQPDKVKDPNKKTHELFTVFAIVLLLTGLILIKVTPIWPLILLYGILNLISIILCKKSKKKSQLLP